MEFETKLIEVISRTDSTKSFRFEVGQELNFKAGQFFFLTIKLSQAEASKPFSISSSPTEKGYLEFTKRITQSEFSQALDKMKPGDWAKIKLPYGNFVYDDKYKKIAFLSGGIGITPIRSITKSIVDKGLDVSVVLLYGNNKEKDIVFRQDFDEIKRQNANIRVVYTLTSPDIDKGSWGGRTGYIDEKMIKEEIPDYKERTFYVCGPPKMVDTLIAILDNKLKLGKGQIIRENFAGY
ncbi:MAG: FAD-dependent oxidoreductase [Candidatus Omnitrophica bacterium]|nr:FAD-dependent oxidoreductase [Candidatus Omnitrophota bacterium]